MTERPYCSTCRYHRVGASRRLPRVCTLPDYRAADGRAPYAVDVVDYCALRRWEPRRWRDRVAAIVALLPLLWRSK